MHPEIVLTTGFQHGMRIAVPGSAARVDLPLYVAVRDNGPGIPDDIRPHLFEPFVTSQRHRQRARPGAGGQDRRRPWRPDRGRQRPGRTEFRLHLPVVTDEEGELMMPAMRLLPLLAGEG